VGDGNGFVLRTTFFPSDVLYNSYIVPTVVSIESVQALKDRCRVISISIQLTSLTRTPQWLRTKLPRVSQSKNEDRRGRAKSHTDLSGQDVILERPQGRSEVKLPVSSMIVDIKKVCAAQNDGAEWRCYRLYLFLNNARTLRSRFPKGATETPPSRNNLLPISLQRLRCYLTYILR